MIEFGGVYYYIDMDALDKAITVSGTKTSSKHTEIETKTVKDGEGNLLGTETLETVVPKGKEIDGAKYDILRMMIEVLIDFDDEIDDSLGAERAFSKTPIAYKLAFNTLISCGVLKEKEE